MRKFIVAALFAVGVIASPPAQAREFGEIYTQCGLGGLIAGSVPVVAVITNITWDLGTTAISSNVSSPETCRTVVVRTAAFINDAAPRLEQDLARGQGPHLAALLELSGCSASAQPAITAALRADLSRSLAAPGAASRTGYQQAAGLFDLYTARVQSDFAKVCTNS
jgi:hypothetical protein